MSQVHRIYGAEPSPYSVKVRSYYRYKGIPHRWIVRNAHTQAEFQARAKLPLIPLVLTPDDEALQDSTPILERLEAEHPEPSIHPADPVARFVSILLEEFGDEWGNKWMFHLRWARPVDQESAAGRIAALLAPDAEGEARAAAVAKVRERMVGRVWFVGSSAENGPRIEASFRDTVAILERHLADRPYLFGGRPAFGDFGLWPQLYELWTDPTPGAYIEGRAPRVLDWVHRMTWPRAEGDFEPWSALEPTLLPLLERQVGRLFLPWSAANAEAIAAGRDGFTVVLDGAPWTQKPQKYHARSLAALRARYVEADRRAVDPILERAGCLEVLRA